MVIIAFFTPFALNLINHNFPATSYLLPIHCLGYHCTAEHNHRRTCFHAQAFRLASVSLIDRRIVTLQHSYLKAWSVLFIQPSSGRKLNFPVFGWITCFTCAAWHLNLKTSVSTWLVVRFIYQLTKSLIMCTVAMQTMLSESYSVRLLQEASEARRQNMLSEACKRYKQTIYSDLYRLQTFFLLRHTSLFFSLQYGNIGQEVWAGFSPAAAW